MRNHPTIEDLGEPKNTTTNLCFLMDLPTEMDIKEAVPEMSILHFMSNVKGSTVEGKENVP